MVEKSSSVLTQSVGSAYAVWMPMVFTNLAVLLNRRSMMW